MCMALVIRMSLREVKSVNNSNLTVLHVNKVPFSPNDH